MTQFTFLSTPEQTRAREGDAWRHRSRVVALAPSLLTSLVAATALTAGASASITINEIRIDQPGTDSDEYFELVGPPNASLAGVTLIVVGDGVGLDGGIEEIVQLGGTFLGNDGLMLVGQAEMTIGTPDLIKALNFENSDNLTFLLVTGFTGTMGMDLDLDDDGVLDVTPWTELLDSVAMVENIETPPVGTEWWYAEPIGPGLNGDPPFHIYRCAGSGAWQIGPNDPAIGLDTPGVVNPVCEEVDPCPADLNSDTIVDGADLAILLFNWGTEPPVDGPPNAYADINADGIVDGIDLGLLLNAWHICS